MTVEARQSEATKTFKQAVASGCAGLPAPTQKKVKIGKVTGKLNLQSAKKYCPPKCHLFHCPTTSRIRGFYVPNMKSVQGNLALGMDTAVRVCLVGLWHMHIAEHGEKCPYDFALTDCAPTGASFASSSKPAKASRAK